MTASQVQYRRMLWVIVYLKYCRGLICNSLLAAWDKLCEEQSWSKIQYHRNRDLIQRYHPWHFFILLYRQATMTLISEVTCSLVRRDYIDILYLRVIPARLFLCFQYLEDEPLILWPRRRCHLVFVFHPFKLDFSSLGILETTFCTFRTLVFLS